MINKNDVSSNWKAIPWNRVFGREIVADRLFLRSAIHIVTNRLIQRDEAAAREQANMKAHTRRRPAQNRISDGSGRASKGALVRSGHIIVTSGQVTCT